MNVEETITLRHYFETLLNDYKAGHEREHQLLTVAMGKAEEAMARRLEGMNELRAQINTERGSYATKSELRPVTQFIDRFWGVIIGVLILNGLVTALVVLVLRKQ